MITSLFLKIVANSLLAYRFCLGNKTGIIFVSLLLVIYFIQWNLYFIIYANKVKFLLRTYWLGFIFYQVSRFCILLFFIFAIAFDMNRIEIYIYAANLCVILLYMYMTNYFNTLMKDIVYNSYFQAIFNYPFEWMNLFCCWCKYRKDCIEDLDYRFCLCDSFFLYLFELLIYLVIFIIYLYYCFFCLILCSNRNTNND